MERHCQEAPRAKPAPSRAEIVDHCQGDPTMMSCCERDAHETKQYLKTLSILQLADPTRKAEEARSGYMLRPFDYRAGAAAGRATLGCCSDAQCRAKATDGVEICQYVEVRRKQNLLLKITALNCLQDEQHGSQSDELDSDDELDRMLEGDPALQVRRQRPGDSWSTRSD